MTLPLLCFLAACISPSPLEPEQETAGPSDLAESVIVSPATVWLWPGSSQELSAQLKQAGIGDTVSFSWESSAPSIVEVDSDGVLHAKVTGSASIDVTANVRGHDQREVRRKNAVSVNVASDAEEAKLATIFGVQRLEGVWSQLAYSPRYDELFLDYGDKHFANNGGTWQNTYYDRGFAWYAGWWRTGNSEFIDRGHVDLLAYRDDYVLANDGKVPPRWVFPEGLAVHYLLTGDAKSLEAIEKMADRMEYVGWLDNMMETKYRDGRIQGRAILVQIIAYVLTEQEHYRERAARGLEGLVEWYESSGANGSWDHPTRTDVSYCGGMATFTITHAIINSMVRYYDLIEPDPRIIPMVTSSLDYSWNYWTPGEGFSYVQPPESFTGDIFECPTDGSSRPAKDVSLLTLTAFGDGYRLTGEERFRTRGDEVLEFGLSGAIYLDGYKQFNQSFMRSYRYLFMTG